MALFDQRYGARYRLRVEAEAIVVTFRKAGGTGEARIPAGETEWNGDPEAAWDRIEEVIRASEEEFRPDADPHVYGEGWTHVLEEFDRNVEREVAGARHRWFFIGRKLPTLIRLKDGNVALYWAHYNQPEKKMTQYIYDKIPPQEAEWESVKEKILSAKGYLVADAELPASVNEELRKARARLSEVIREYGERMRQEFWCEDGVTGRPKGCGVVNQLLHSTENGVEIDGELAMEAAMKLATVVLRLSERGKDGKAAVDVARKLAMAVARLLERPAA